MKSAENASTNIKKHILSEFVSYQTKTLNNIEHEFFVNIKLDNINFGV